MIDTIPVISARQVVKVFGALRAVDGVDLEVRPGEIFGLIGHNGAGKSTLFKLMLGLIEATAGEIRVGGVPVKGRGFRVARRQVGYLPENVVLYDNLSGLETLQFFARLKRVPRAECAPMLERVGLGGVGDKPVRAYSKGMRQRLGFAQALLGSPRVLFLDEPTGGLDPAAIRDFYATLRSLRAEGVTIIITSHILAELQERVDRLAIMANGRIQAMGTVAQLREQADMPLTLLLKLRSADATGIGRQFERVAGVRASVGDHGDRLVLSVPQMQKMPALRALAALGDEVQDLAIHEPSLEDVFFGLAREQG
ncbi:MAG: ABC transporter ATP-binding protein [Burkholderiales bacterium]|nr:ABC transporter ATP-binding protein [Burkholderiales bacterium]